MGSNVILVMLAGLLAMFLCAGCDEEKQPATPEGTAEEAKPAEGEAQAEPDAAKLEGKAVLEAKCKRCHSLDKVYGHDRVDRDHWAETVDKMVAKGAVLSDAEREALLDFLASQ